MIRHIAVLIPARNEEARIESCLNSVLRAAQNCPVPVAIIVVADSCTDHTEQIVRKYPEVTLIAATAGNVGIARALAASEAMRGIAGSETELWLANTDADSRVPANWLLLQLELANAGNDLVIGTVRPDPAEYPPELQRDWLREHILGRPNGHVHGANLGVRASVYQAVGGFMPFAEHEDVDLVARLAGAPYVASDRAEVITSARLIGKTPGGYAAYLAKQSAQRGGPSITFHSAR